MIENKIIMFCVLINLNLTAQNDLYTKSVKQKHGYNLGSYTKNVCTDNVLCKIYPNQNMCLLEAEIPKELKNLSYVIYPTQVNAYNTARFNFNKRFNIYPHAIIKPENASQVAYIVSVMHKLKLNFSVRSGGHCYESGSLSNEYILDLGNFNSIVPNIEKQEVYLGAGCLLGNVIQTLGNINFAIPAGICPSVGVAGLALGGGIGFLSRGYGLTSDSIKSIIMVDANSKIIEVTATNKYSDLFWALCGAGNGSYGVVLGFTFKMYNIPKSTLVRLAFEWESANIIDLFKTWQNWIKTLPSDIASELNFVYSNKKLSIAIESYRPNAKPFTQWQGIFDKFNPKVSVSIGTYLQCSKKIASSFPNPFSKAKSKFLFKPLSNQGIQVIIDYYNQLQLDQTPFLVLIEFGVAKGKILKGNSAYFSRNAFIYNFQFIYWDLEIQTTAAISSINKFYNNFAPYTSIYSYSNLVDYDLGNTYLNAYYGTHVNRLIKIKNKYDPLNIFKWHQSISVKLT